VAHTDLLLRPSGTRGVQWATLVHREHRGHRLGAAVKVANLRRLQRDRPDITEVVTQNAEVNDQMIAINTRLGFAPVALVPEFVRRL
jgi:RimJ/RimL family protein N-acetyltransferase